MRLKTSSLLIGLAVLNGCAATSPKKTEEVTITTSATLTSNSKQASNKIDLIHIKTLHRGQLSLDKSAYEQGLSDALASKSIPDATTQEEWQALA
jgi:hypothetical protein